MRPSLLSLAVAGTALAFASCAGAVQCYRVLDRTDRVVYQDVKPPVDMSDRGAAERAALRARGGYLMITDVESCFELVFDATLLADARPKTVDDIVSGFRQFATSGGVSRSGVASPTGISMAPASGGARTSSSY